MDYRRLSYHSLSQYSVVLFSISLLGLGKVIPGPRGLSVGALLPTASRSRHHVRLAPCGQINTLCDVPQMINTLFWSMTQLPAPRLPHHDSRSYWVYFGYICKVILFQRPVNVTMSISWHLAFYFYVLLCSKMLTFQPKAITKRGYEKNLYIRNLKLGRSIGPYLLASRALSVHAKH